MKETLLEPDGSIVDQKRQRAPDPRQPMLPQQSHHTASLQIRGPLQALKTDELTSGVAAFGE